MLSKTIRIVCLLVINLCLSLSAWAATVEVIEGVEVIRDKGKPKVEVFDFEANYSSAIYTLSFYNGGKESRYCRISSAVIKLNGDVIFSPDDLNQQVFLLRAEVNLQLNNQLSVELRSKPGCAIEIGIIGELTNTAPVANNLTFSTNEDQQTQITLSATDAEQDPLTYVATTLPQHGQLQINGVQASYIPNANYFGSDSFQYKANDGELDSNLATVNIIVNSVNDAPTLTIPTITISEDQATTITLAGEDPDGGNLTYVVVSPPAHGTASISGNQLTFTPTANYNGNDSFGVVANDGVTQSGIAIGTVIVDAVNDAPVALGQQLAVNEDELLVFNVSATDIDGDELVFSIVKQPASGTISGTLPNLIYQPNPDFYGADSFTFSVNDGSVDSAIATVSLQINGVNDAPVAIAQSIEINEDNSINLVLSGNDKDNDKITFSVVGQPANGILKGSAPNLEYVPNLDYFGSDEFTFQANDGVTDSAIGTIEVIVKPINDSPTITITSPSDGETLPAGLAIMFDATSDDPEDGELSANISWTASPGSIALGNGSSVSAVLAAGKYVVTASITDSENLSVQESITVNVEIPNNLPEITSTPLTSVIENTEYRYDVNATDVDGDEIIYSLSSAPSGMIIDGQSGLVQWQPDSTFANGNLEENAYCRVPASEQTQVPVAMDAVMVVDGSGSNQESWPWVSGAMAELNVDLKLSGVGAAAEQNRFGLVGFGTSPVSFEFENGLFGSISELFEATFDGNSPGGIGSRENGLRALQFAIDNYSFRNDIPRNIIWIPDERQQGALENGENLETFTQRLINGRFNVQLITFLALQCNDGRKALGVDSDGRGYVADGNGGYNFCEIDLAQLENTAAGYQTGFVEPFILPALASGGAAWSLDVLRKTNGSESLRKALTSRMFNTTLISQNEQELADITVEAVNFTQLEGELTQINMNLLNRGLAPLQQTVTVKFLNALNNDQVLGTMNVSNISAGEQIVVNHTLTNAFLPDELRVVLEISEGQECLTNNNQLTVPVVQVKADDGKGGVAGQTFSITVQDSNQSPKIISQPALEIPVGQKYQYQLEIEDPDLGDDHQYTLVGNGKVKLDLDSGAMSFQPGAEDIGTHQITVKVTDLAGAEDSQSFTLTVAGDYQLPEFTNFPETGRTVVNEQFHFTPVVNTDPDSILEFTFSEAPAGMTINAADGAVKWVATEDDINRLRLVSA